MEASKMEAFKQFIDQCKANPLILHTPSLSFFKAYLQSLGAKIPSEPKQEYDSMEEEQYTSAGTRSSGEDEIVESDIELDASDVVEPDNDPPQEMGDRSAEVTEETQDAAQMAKSKAMEAISEGKLDEAITFLTEAVQLNPTSAILHGTRGSVFLKLKKPNAAIRDAEAALQINPDSAKGYKVRGMARAMLGQWQEAANDLHIAAKLDYDEEIESMLKKVEPNAHKIEEHRKKYDRLRKERELKRAEHERKLRQEAQDRAAASGLKDGEVIQIRMISDLEAKLKAASKTSRLGVLYFTATWCGPCRFISPLVTSSASKYPKVVFLKIDIDEAREVASRYNISSVPTFIFVKNGQEIDKVVGADKNVLESKIAQHAG
ncbi:hypothetical protein ACFE04_006320 [Oxalis oulophora]